MATVFPEQLTPGYSEEDYGLIITVPGSGSIAGWTLASSAVLKDGTVVPAGNVTTTITDAVNRVIVVVVSGYDVSGSYVQVTTRRTDPGFRTVVYSGVLPIIAIP